MSGDASSWRRAGGGLHSRIVQRENAPCATVGSEVHISKQRHTDDEFIAAVSGNTTIAGVLRTLGYSHQGTAYRMVNQDVARLGLYTTHWVGQRHGTSPRTNRIPLAEVLVENSTYRSTTNLRQRLIQEGILEERCVECGGGVEWNGKPITLQLDHINGISTDNRLKNLRILCPNCHTQTDTYGGKKHRKNNKCSCGAPIRPKSIRCRDCSCRQPKAKKAAWPPLEALREWVERESYSAVGRALGVSGNAVKKHLGRVTQRESATFTR